MRVFLVDDEPPALRWLTTLLEQEEDVEVCGTATEGAEAIEGIRRERPDLVLLDVRMPEMSGFDLVRALGTDRPLVVFVTAYDEHALDAYQHGVFDYVTKPVEEARLQSVLLRVRDALGGRAAEVPSPPNRVLEELSALLPSRRRFPVRTAAGRVSFVNVGAIERVEVDGSHLKLWINRKAHRVRMTMAEFEARIPPGILVRVHRSAMVNVDFIREVQPYLYGDFAIVMRDGSHVITGRTYRDAVRALIGTG